MPNGTCTALRRNGEFCDSPSMPDTPFPICPKHAAKIFMHLRDKVNGATWTDKVDAVLAAQPTRKRAPARVGTIYYVRMGDLIKIGYTGNLTQRMRAYVGGDLVAKERGTLTTEAQRHKQFAAHLARGHEWFHAAPELMEHIGSLQEQAA